ncbi:FAD-dependent monooxygenase [Sandaracinobacteroides saxicola]|uniref:FAD-dependent monooxygenase n=1 Tax=Sandaracinobacteroides saxicola TaxID=2759707 RepID=A0A7G5IGE6_9SPHN|nr:FAD-dependent monooxygenase [Sandaracinobacteroides saxicola]QMW22438.1 FAD-dependent monooxygenase [Sandaracinobacteroides saxicola]
MTEVCIVGAGLGGLTCALALARQGVGVTVLEQAPALGEVGAGITLSPNSSRVMAHLGLGERLAPLAVVPGTQVTQHWQSGAVVRTTARGAEMLSRHGFPYVHLHRADLHGVLAAAVAAAAPGAIRLGQAVARAGRDGTVTLADGRRLGPFDAVVGADGVRSAVRAALWPTEPPPHFTGQVAWRGIVPADALPVAHRAHSPGIHVGPGKLFMRYPVRGGSLVNYAAFVAMDGWRDDSWSIRSTVAELLEHFGDWDALVPAIIGATAEGQLFKWALHARAPLDDWVRGRVTLLGDAAHAMLPFLGQGAGTAIEDGMVLARCLAGFPVQEALARYEAARRERTTMVQAQSRMIGMAFQGEDPASLGRGPMQDEEALGLFDYDAIECKV